MTETESNMKKTPSPSGDDESDVESVLEFDTEGCLPPDEIDDTLQPMGDNSKLPTEEEKECADDKRTQAVFEFVSGNYEKSAELLGEAINLNPTSAALFSKRGQVFLNMSKPNACVKDCTKALELNCDSATAYKFRGRAYRLLGEWEKSAQDLRQAANIDYDEQTNEWLKEVQPNAQKIEMHQMKMHRKKLELEEKVKIARSKAYREANMRDSANRRDQPNDEETIGMADIYKILEDPEILKIFQDPEVEAAFKDISLNPENQTKYQHNPKIQAIIEKLSSKLGSAVGGGNYPSNVSAFGPDAPPVTTLPDEDNLD